MGTMKTPILAGLLLLVLGPTSGAAPDRSGGWYCTLFTVDGRPAGYRDGSCERDQGQCLQELSNLTQSELKDGKRLHVIGNACAFRPRAYVTSYYMPPGPAATDAAFPSLRTCRQYTDNWVVKTTFPITRNCALSR